MDPISNYIHIKSLRYFNDILSWDDGEKQKWITKHIQVSNIKEYGEFHKISSGAKCINKRYCKMYKCISFEISQYNVGRISFLIPRTSIVEGWNEHRVINNGMSCTKISPRYKIPRKQIK